MHPYLLNFRQEFAEWSRSFCWNDLSRLVFVKKKSFLY